MALNIMYQNVRGLGTKINTFKQNVSIVYPDILFVTESWLNGSILDYDIVDLNQYLIFRRDRESTKSNKSDGGGVFIAIKN